jgi:hypothetical protein
MTVETGERLAIGYNFGDGSAGWGVNINRTLQMIDAMLGGLVVKSATTAAPPSAPSTGDAYALPAGSSGVWTGQDGNIAVWQLGAWQFFPGKVTGLRMFVEDTAGFYYYDGSEVTSEGGGGGGGGASWSNVPPEGQRLPLGFVIPGKPAASQGYFLPMAMALNMAANLAGTVVYANTAGTGNSVFTFNKISSGVSSLIGTVTIAAGSKTATALTGSAVSIGIGDVIQLVAPSTQDATLADIGITLLTAKV